MDIEVKIHGLEEVKAAFKELPQRVASKVLRRGVASAAFMFRKAAREAAPIRDELGSKFISSRKHGLGRREPGYLKKKWGIKYLKQRSNKNEAHYGMGNWGPTYYGYIADKGHVIGKRPSGKIARKKFMATAGRVPGLNIIDPTFARIQMQMIERMKEGFGEAIIKEGEKLGFKSARL